jgi:FMN-dependent NADH-azoreductase
MKIILMDEVSPRGKDSASRSVADTLAERLTDLYPLGKLIRRDLAAEPLPHLARLSQNEANYPRHGIVNIGFTIL